MRKSRYVGTYAFLFSERKVNYMEAGNPFLGTERIGRGVLPGAVRAVPLGDYQRENLSGLNMEGARSQSAYQ